MKKILFSYVALLISVCAFANEGIQFSDGTWKEILSKAKVENKLVFIDVYTSWCGPCKKMSAEVFPMEKVGKVFNASFVNYAIDAEKGEGIDIAKKFGVRAFPTYLFVNGDGQLIYRTTGYMPAKAFLLEAQIALKEKNDPKPFVQWEDEYNSGKRGKTFLLGYLKKRSLLKLPSAEIAEELFPLLTKEDLANKELLSTMLYFDPAVQYVPGGKVFNYVMDNYKELDSSKTVRYPLAIMESGTRNYFQKNIILNKREEMLPVMIKAFKQVMIAAGQSPADIVVIEKELSVNYYAGTNNESKLIPAVIDYVHNGIMKLDIAAKQKADKEKFEKFMEPYLSGEADSAKDQKFAMKRLMKNNDMLSVSYNLRSAAEAVYNTIDNKKMLEKATEWARQADEWFPHFSSKAVYAGLLFKTGLQQNAIGVMELASEDPFLLNAAEVKKLLLKNVDKMKKGEAPKSLWKL